ncbi:hypothetical protein [Mycoplasmopsis lipofaciens]|uniref:hypothetical protein n=1 Tax=Mycoplasmopsis lipofaciens TaxID=114884 RepID=UPI000481DE6E|nr:hypothetical protein [Mycoplasmopsis lipofaciens]
MEYKSIKQMGLTKNSDTCLTKLIDFDYISDKQDGARIAAIYAIKNKLYQDKNLNEGYNGPTTWNIDNVDPGGWIQEIIKFQKINKNCHSTVAFKSLVNIGLEDIYEKIKDIDKSNPCLWISKILE